MYLKAVGGVNFLGYKHLELQVEPGLWLIDGVNHHYATASSNASGKSSLEEAICYPLFGRTIRPLQVADIIREGADYAYVWNEYIKSDGSTVRVERYRDHPKHGTTARLLLNGEDSLTGRYVNQGKSNTTQRIIDQLGFDYDLFVRSIVLHSRVTESFVTVKDRYLKMITEKLIGLPDFRPLQDRVKDVSRVAEGVVQSLTDKIWSINHHLSEKRKTVERLTKQHAQYETEQHQRTAKLAAELRTAKRELAAARAELERYETKEQKTDRILKRKKTAQKRVAVALRKIERRREHILKEIAQLRVRLEMMDNRYETQSSLEGTECPECGQLVPKGYADKIRSEQRTEYQHVKAALAEATRALQLNAKRYTKAQHEMETAVLEISRVEHKLNAAKVKQGVNQLAIKTAKGKVRQLEESLKETVTNPYAQLLAESKHAMVKLTKRIAELKILRSKREKRLLYYEFWRRGFGPHGIRSYILDAVIPTLNKNTNVYLNVLTDGQMNFRMSYREKKTGELADDFYIEVKNLSGAPVLAGGSDGELASVDMAVNFAMNDVLEARMNDPLGFLFLDQVVDLVDTARGKKAIQLLNNKLNPEWCRQQLKHYGAVIAPKRTVWVITHREHLKGLFEDRILVEKKNKICRVMEQ